MALWFLDFLFLSFASIRLARQKVDRARAAQQSIASAVVDIIPLAKISVYAAILLLLAYNVTYFVD